MTPLPPPDREIDIDALRALHAATTPGTWKLGTSRYGPGVMPAYICIDDAQICEVMTFARSDRTADDVRQSSHANAAYIVAAHNTMPALLDHVASLSSRLEQAERRLAASRHVRAVETSHARKVYQELRQARDDARAHLAAIDAPETILCDESHPNGLTPAMRALRVAAARMEQAETRERTLRTGLENGIFELGRLHTALLHAGKYPLASGIKTLIQRLEKVLVAAALPGRVDGAEQ